MLIMLLDLPTFYIDLIDTYSVCIQNVFIVFPTVDKIYKELLQTV